MVLDELATYLAGAGLGLVVGTSLHKDAFPAGSEDLGVLLQETDSAPPEESFGESLSAVDVERPRVKVIVRGTVDDPALARALAQSVWKKLRRLGPVELSGTHYLHVGADSPSWLGPDKNERPRWHFDLDVWKQESAA